MTGKVDRKPGDSHFWAGLMKVKEIFFGHDTFHLNKGKRTRFWEDRWLGNISLQHQYPTLYNIVRRKSATVESVLSTVPLNVSFCRFLNDNNCVLWNDLVGGIMHIWLNYQNDVFSWNLHQHSQYMVHSLYLALIDNGMASQMHKQIWRLKVPFKIKNFMWYMKKEVVLTKDNLAWRHWDGSKQCSFCLHNETIQHMFFDCYYARFLWGLTQIVFNLPPPHNIQHMFNTWSNQVGGKLRWQILAGASAFCWAIWLSRNDVVFDEAPIKSLMQLLYRGTHSLRFWSQLEKDDQDKEKINTACRKLEMVTMETFAAHGWSCNNRICA
jgi:hypothetical protein